MRFSKSLYWILQTTGWGTFMIINILMAVLFGKMSDEASARLVLIRLCIFVLTGIVSTHLMRALIVRLKTTEKPVRVQFAVFFFLTVIFSVSAAVLYMPLCSYFDLLNYEEKKFHGQFILLIFSSAYYFMINLVIWNLIYFIVHFAARYRHRQDDASRLEDLIRQAAAASPGKFS